MQTLGVKYWALSCQITTAGCFLFGIFSIYGKANNSNMLKQTFPLTVFFAQKKSYYMVIQKSPLSGCHAHIKKKINMVDLFPKFNRSDN
jgi:hypothetical protein